MKYYVTTPIYYINGLPHIGHVYTTVLCDVIARYHRLFGNDVYFLTGTDEHGQKAEKAAHEAGLTPLEMADRIVPNFQSLWKRLNISINDFIRTTEPRHHEGVEELFRRAQASGDIYKGSYEGWYCTSDEAFFTEAQLQDGKCPDCGRAVEKIKEESYFFRLSRFQKPLLDHYHKNPDSIIPRSRYNEVVSFIEGGLRDLSISRVKVEWGVHVPGDPNHVIYVWFDALCNYATAVGFPSDPKKFERYWPADVHVVGKDIIRFHAVYWPAFLLSGGLPLPRQIFAHGWWMNEDVKISKSRANAVEPNALIEIFGVDGLRYFLMREAPIESDSNYSLKTILKRVNSDLANDLGNLTSRSITMVQKYAEGVIPAPEPDHPPFRDSLAGIAAALPASVQRFAFPRLLADIWEVVNQVNRYIVDEQPWVLAKDPAKSGRLNTVLYNTCEALRLMATLVEPVIPESANQIRKLLGTGDAGLQWGGLKPGSKTGTVVPIFPRIDEKDVDTDTEPAEESAEPAEPTEGCITIEDFQKIGLKVGEIKAAEKIKGSKKLLKMMVDLGTETRQLVAGIAAEYSPDDLVGRQIVVVTNLKPAKLMGVESNGMILAASVEGKPVLLSLSAPVPNGTIVK